MCGERLGLFLLKIEIFMSCTLSVSDTSFSRFSDHDGKLLSNGNTSSFTTRSRIHCSSLCSINNCSSYFYNRINKTCQINNDVINFDVTSHDESGWQYYQRTGCPIRENTAKDCKDLYEMGETTDGVYTISPFNNGTSIHVLCDMTLGGYTVIQNRFNGSVDFYRSWLDYAVGFGDPPYEYWIGNDAIHALTKDTNTTLRIELETFSGSKTYAVYSYFSTENEQLNYQLHIGTYQGTASDGLRHSNINYDANGASFSTYDRNNDVHTSSVCTTLYHSAGWFKACGSWNLNGIYCGAGATNPDKKCNWWNSFGSFTPMKTSVMKVKRD